MLTIQNIDKLNDYRDADWFVREMWTTDKAYIIQIEKKIGYWPVGGMQIGSLTIYLDRECRMEWRGHRNYKMSTNFITNNQRFETIVTFDEMMTLDSFIWYGIINHIKYITR